SDPAEVRLAEALSQTTSTLLESTYDTVNSPIFPFSFSGYRHNRDLHTFPTRRSSDLVAPQEKDLGCEDHAGSAAGHCCGQQHCRSEEHTSELQSRENLVCRLLLEKKKDERDTSSSTHMIGTRCTLCLHLSVKTKPARF